MSRLSITMKELREIAQEHFSNSKAAAEEIGLPARVKMSRTASYQMSANPEMVESFQDHSILRELRACQGFRAWGAMMSYDLRKSSKRATRIGPKDTYITMHTLLPTLLAIVKGGKGISVGLRGDGGIGTFGMVEIKKGQNDKVTPQQAELAVSMACLCGTAMINAVAEVVNPILVEGDIDGDLHLGVGIDVGEFVATNIGYGNASDLTAYGDCVNKACKRLSTGADVVVLSHAAMKMFPTEKGGKTSFRRYPDRYDAYILRYPDDYRVIR